MATSTNTTTADAAGGYLTPQEAREQWAKSTGLPVGMAPTYPEGCREYAEYAARLREALDGWKADGPAT